MSAELPSGFTLDDGPPEGFTPDVAGAPMPPNMGPVEPKSPMPKQLPLQEGLANFGSSAIGGMAGKVAGTLAGNSDAYLKAQYGREPLGPQVESSVTNALTYQPRSQGGQTVANALAWPGQKYQQLAGWLGGKTTEKTGSPMAGEMVQKGMEIAPYGLGRAPGGRVPRVGMDPAEAMFDVNQPAPVMAAPAADAGAIQRAKDAGLRLTPREGGGGPISRGLATYAGEPSVAKTMAKANEPITGKLLAQDLPGAGGEINVDSLARVRQQANAGYEAARQSGLMVADPQLSTALDKVVEDFRKQAASFAGNPAVQANLKAAEDMIEGIGGPKNQLMDADATISKINSLRSDAKGMYRSGTPGSVELAGAARATADALEAQIERHLVRTKQPQEIIQGFREARTVLAKAHDAEEASRTGTVNPQAYGLRFNQRNHGGMTGGALQVGEAASKFPRSMSNPRNVGDPSGPTIADMVNSAAVNSMLPGAAPHWGWDIASMGTRPAIRAALASRPGQAMIGAPLSPAAAGVMGLGIAPQATAAENKKAK